MDLDWSAQSAHIRTLFRPWKPGDGYDEATVQAAETRLGLRLPHLLRNFSLAWGRRQDLTQAQNPLVAPDGLVVRADTLIFCVENQAVVYWGIRCDALEADDPPVVVTASGPSGCEVETELNWTPSHTHLSGFLDDLAYDHAFARGALYGGATAFGVPLLQAQHLSWLEEHWSKARVGPLFYGVMAPDSVIDRAWPPLYVRDGQAFCQFSGYGGIGPVCCLVAREAEAFDEISQRFQIAWARRW